MTRRENLAEWIRSKHDCQLIKCTNEPYFEHLKFVAEMAAPAALLGYEVGLAHDLLEKTITTCSEFYESLIDFGYSNEEAKLIVKQVIELTDVFTKAAYPELKKSVRKNRESSRLTLISRDSQTVKYADLIYNIKWMLLYKPKLTEKYLKRKFRLLKLMNNGDPDIHQQAILLIKENLLKY